MARKRKRLRRGYGEGSVQSIVEGQKYRIVASGGIDHNGKRLRTTRIFYGSEAAATKALRDLQRSLDDGDCVLPERLTLQEWVEEWFLAEYGVSVFATADEMLLHPASPGRTTVTYSSMLRVHILPRLGHIRLQQLRATHLRQYLGEVGSILAAATCQGHYMLMQTILEGAKKEGLVKENVARLITGKPKANREVAVNESMAHCWTREETQAFLSAARDAGTQLSALFTLALDSGARKGELLGLKWEDVNWEEGAITIRRSLTRPGSNPIFGSTKGKRMRKVALMPETIALLKTHRASQNMIRLAAGKDYHNFGLVFAKDKHRSTMGNPLQSNNIGQREFANLIKIAGVKPIKFHGLRHTCATLLLQAGEVAKNVSERLGHKDVATTLEIYTHVTPTAVKGMVNKLRKELGFID